MLDDSGSLSILRVTYLPHFEQNPTMRELREKALTHICRHSKITAIPNLRGFQPPNIAYAMTADPRLLQLLSNGNARYF